MQYLMGRYTVSARRACLVIRTTRSSVYYKSRKDPLTGLRQRMRELAQDVVCQFRNVDGYPYAGGGGRTCRGHGSQSPLAELW